VSEANFSRLKIPKPVYFSFLLIPLSVGMFPHVFQHWLTARSARAFKLPIVMHPIFIMIVWMPCVLLGVWASAATSGIRHGSRRGFFW
jgi:SSS family solute:Na+ symporter